MLSPIENGNCNIIDISYLRRIQNIKYLNIHSEEAPTFNDSLKHLNEFIDSNVDIYDLKRHKVFMDSNKRIFEN